MVAIETKQRILDVAERLFADSGFNATSLRDITSEAGVNLASVNYHFGSKEALLAAILDRRFAPVNRRRLDLLDTLEASVDGAVDLAALVRAFLSPPFELHLGEAGDPQAFLKLVGRIHSETDDVRALFVSLFQPIVARFEAAFRKALPHVEADEVARRTHFLVGAMAHTMMWCESFVSPAVSGPNSSKILESLIQFGTAGLGTQSRRPSAAPARTGAQA